MSSKKPNITEVVLRDGQQSLIATRMKTEDMLPVLSKLDKVGYSSLEVWGGATYDCCLRFLNENPWDRLKIFKKKLLPKFPYNQLVRNTIVPLYLRESFSPISFVCP